MRISYLSLILATLIVTSSSLAADTPTDSDWNQAMTKAVSTLVTNQESMEPVTKVNRKEMVAREWPYEGVYRERGEIPPGYRVGGTAIVLRSLIESPGWKKTSTNFHEAGTSRWANAESPSQEARNSAPPWPGPSSYSHPSCCSTTPSRPSTRRRRKKYSPSSGRPQAPPPISHK